MIDELPKLMGILNVTPDSFSDGGDVASLDAAMRRAERLIESGAAILDVGGESTRPGADPVDEATELDRVVPVIEAITAKFDTPVSIDTTKSRVAEAALSAGACMVNDISGLTFDENMASVCAEADCEVVCMHIQGTPRTMQDSPIYKSVVEDVCDWLAGRVTDLRACGVNPGKITLDPGIGFGKTAEHNLQLLSNVARIRALGFPVLVGHSRKRFLKSLLNRPVEERLGRNDRRIHRTGHAARRHPPRSRRSGCAGRAGRMAGGDEARSQFVTARCREVAHRCSCRQSS